MVSQREENYTVDFIQFEYGIASQKNDSSLKQIFKTLRDSGYSVFRIYSGGLIFIPKWDDSLENFKYSNFLAVTNFQFQDVIDENCQTFSSPQEAFKMALYALPKNSIVLEAGAYDGAHSVWLSKIFPGGTIHSFEPVPQNYVRLKQKTNKYKNIKTYETALGDAIGSVTFYVSAFTGSPTIPSASSSFLKPKEHLEHASHVIFNNGITVPVTTLDQWAKDNNVDHVDFMWLDMQGAELIALRAGTNILKTVKAIVTEVEFVEAYEKQPLFKDVKD